MLDDRELLDGIRKRDPEAFRALMGRHAKHLINLAYRFLGTVADAEDVAQDVFFRLYEHPPTLHPSTKFSTWLYRVTANRCLDLLRAKSRRPKMVPLEIPNPEDPEAQSSSQQLTSPAANPRDQIAQKETATATRAAIATLPLELRSPLLLSTIEELSQETIAQILGISAKAVERRIHRARVILKERLAAYL